MKTNPLAASFPLLSEHELEVLSALAEPVCLDEGALLLEEGRHADVMYLIVDGVATATRALGDVEIFIADMGEGELVGEVSFAGNFTATATVRASSDLKVLRINRGRLLELFDREPMLGMGAFRSIALTLSRRLLRLTERFATLSA